MNRRRFLGVSTAALSLPSCRTSAERKQWKGIAMGIDVSVQYYGSADLEAAQKIVKEAENALTLWSEDSALSRLNREGVLLNPPAPLLVCLKKSRELFEASEGLFDPTIHSFLKWVKAEYQAGREPQAAAIARQLKRVDFDQVEFSESKILMPSGVALSFNGIAQGYLTDLFAENFSGTSALINFGEYRVLGEDSWPVEVKGESHQLTRALAVSSGSGQRLSATSAANHLIDPRTGKSPPPKKIVAVEADEAWLADGLSTVVAIGGRVPKSFENVRVL